MKRVLEWVAIASVPVVKGIMDSMQFKSSWRTSALKVSQFLTSENLTLHELGNENIGLDFRAFLGIHTYAVKDGWVGDLFFLVFRKRIFPVTPLSSVRLLHVVLENSQANVQKPY